MGFPWTIQELKNLIQNLNSYVLFLIETRLMKYHMLQLCCSLGLSYHVIVDQNMMVVWPYHRNIILIFPFLIILGR